MALGHGPLPTHVALDSGVGPSPGSSLDLDRRASRPPRILTPTRTLHLPRYCTGWILVAYDADPKLSTVRDSFDLSINRSTAG